MCLQWCTNIVRLPGCFAEGVGSGEEDGITLILEKVSQLGGGGCFAGAIDGYNEEVNDHIRGSGTFSRILRGIRLISEAKQEKHGRVRLICSHTLMRPNFKSIDKMVDLCTDVGLQNLIISSLRRTGGAEKLYAELAVS